MLSIPVIGDPIAPLPAGHDFGAEIEARGIILDPVGVDTLQINVGALCNQACRHCHVDAGPKRTEMMNARTADACLDVIARYPEIKTVDITGGAPELSEHFERLARESKHMGRHVIVRHNFTVTLDPHPVSGVSMMHLPDLFAELKLEVISSLPYYQEYFTDKQRGHGVFAKSIESMRMLNERGYGADGSGLALNLVFNPVGAFLPASQESLEIDFKRELARHGLRFNNLYAITNMPIHRFREQLDRLGTKLVNAFNPSAARNVMCRSMVSVGYDGRLYDCDFNQMLTMQIVNGHPRTIFDFDLTQLKQRRIEFANHCFGCTAGSGSSCGGAVA
jgi:radical SAM/Cys-rich protein